MNGCMLNKSTSLTEVTSSTLVSGSKGVIPPLTVSQVKGKGQEEY